MGLAPVWVTPNGLFTIHTDSGEKYVNGAKSELNTQLSASLTRNKYLTRVLLGRHGLPNIPYASPATMMEARLFLENYHTIVVKPRDGFGSHDIHIVESWTQLTGIPLTGRIFEQYITGREMRYLVLDGRVIGVHESRYGTSVAPDRHLERIAYESNHWNAEHEIMAIKIADILGLRFAAVDFMITPEGTTYVLEVNSSPGLKWFHAPTSGPAVDVAAMLLEASIQSY